MKTRTTAAAAAKLCAACTWALSGVAQATGAPTATAATAAAAAARFQTLDVQHVAVDLRLDWPTRSAFGTTTVTLRTKAATRTVALDAAQLAIDTVTDAHGRALHHSYSGGDEDGALLITLDREHPAGRTLQLRVAYRTRHVNHSDPQNLWGSVGKGLRFFQPTSTDARKRLQAWSSGAPGANRYWFPGVDNPQDRRTSDLRLTVPQPLVVLSAGTLASMRTNGDGTRTFHWRVRQPQANHRLAFVAGTYTTVKQRLGGIRLLNHSYPDEKQGTADSAVLLPDMLRYFQRLTGSRYPHASHSHTPYAQVFVQDLPWGHAATGLAVQTENMVDDAGTHEDFKYLWNLLQAESLAQQWFGNHLSAATWGDAWLDRAFARHLAGLYTEQRYGRDEFLLWTLQADQATALADWQAGNRQPVALTAARAMPPASSALATDHAAGNAPYARGAAVLHLLRTQLGDTTWRRVVRHYVARHGGQTVVTKDLKRAVETVTGKPMAWFFEQWVTGSGQPLFEMVHSWDASTRRLHLSVKQLDAARVDAAVGKADPTTATTTTTTPSTPRYFQGAVDIDIDGRVQRVWLHAQAQNTYSWRLPQQPRWVHFDHQGAWLKELRTPNKTTAELLLQLQHSSDAVGRQWAMSELVQRARQTDSKDSTKDSTNDSTNDSTTDRTADPATVQRALLQLARDGANGRNAWRLRFNALRQLQALLAPAVAGQPAPMDDDMQAQLQALVRDESTWLRAAALGVLGQSRNPAHRALYISHLRDRSDRVINAAAIALGRTGRSASDDQADVTSSANSSADDRAYAALAALPAHPSWKNQSLISALAGLRELGDARAGMLALQALADVQSPRWTLSTPVWDYRIAAAQTLAALGQGARGVPLVLQHLKQALAEDDVNDIFSNGVLLVALGDAGARPAFALLKQRFANDPQATAAAQQLEDELENKLKPR